MRCCIGYLVATFRNTTVPVKSLCYLMSWGRILEFGFLEECD